MPARSADDWSPHVDQVIRSRRYTWLGEGLGGAPAREALVSVVADVLHICRREGLDWPRVLAEAQRQFEIEERDAERQEVAVD